MNNIRVLVTGGEGFIAKHVIEKLKMIPNVMVFSFDEYMWNKHLNYLSEIEFDVIIHTAAIARTMECNFDLKRSFESNVLLTHRILNEIKYKKIIYLSSCAIYGNQYPIKYDTIPNPETIYSSQKYFSENMVHLTCIQRGIPSTCLRLFNTYGPGQSQSGSYPNVIASMIRSYKKNGYVEVTGDGKQTRNFVYVDDVVNAIIKSMELNGNNILNIAGHNLDFVSSIYELALKIVSRDENKIRFIPDRPGDIRIQNQYVYLNRNILDWTAKITFNQGIEKVLKHESLV